MTEKEKMLAGKLYLADDGQLVALRKACKRLLRRLNRHTVFNKGKSEKIVNRLFGSVGVNPFVERPFLCDYGCHIFAGDNLFINYGCIILDVCPVRIGDNVMLGPGVAIYTAEHPLDAETRRTGIESGRPVTIGNDVWVGGGTVINPGVTIGSRVVIGSGSVVTRDIPDDCIAAGNPCRVKRANS